MDEIKETYEIVAGVPFKISILSEKGILKYNASIPRIGAGTRALLNELKAELVRVVQVSAAEIIDPEAVASMKEKFKARAEQMIKEKVPKIDTASINLFISLLLNEMLGLGNIELLLQDPNLEEIVIVSAKEPVRIYHKKYGWLPTNIQMSNEEEIVNYSNIIARRVGRQITTLQPLLDAHLVTGDRANAVLYPINTKGNTITIRKFARDPWTVVDLVKSNTCTSGIFSVIWLAIEYEMNILISGGTASGKTTMLNVCMPFIPPNHRLISIEDTRELQLPEYLYWTPLVTRQPNPEGKGEVNMLDLLINSLRMRPDRIILGEIRRAVDAEVLFEAMHTGHSVYATVHADTINQTIQRLISPPISLPANLLDAVHLNIVMFRDRRTGRRRTLQIGEFLVETQEGGKTTVNPNIIYRWEPSSDTLKPHADSLRLFEELSRHTGMTQEQINDDIEKKRKIIEWLVKFNVRGIENVGKIMRNYYLDRDSVINAVLKGKTPDEFLA